MNTNHANVQVMCERERERQRERETESGRSRQTTDRRQTDRENGHIKVKIRG